MVATAAATAMEKQNNKHSERFGQPRLEIGGEGRAHWEGSYSKGSFAVEFTLSANGNWLEIDTNERGEKSAKRTMITLNRESLNALKSMLNSIDTTA